MRIFFFVNTYSLLLVNNKVVLYYNNNNHAHTNNLIDTTVLVIQQYEYACIVLWRPHTPYILTKIYLSTEIEPYKYDTSTIITNSILISVIYYI